jgi:uncharacterized protein (UPF0261 family)
MKTIALFATLDTKGAEASFVRDRLREAGVATHLVDCGTNEPVIQPDISSEQVASVAGASITQLRARQDRGEAVTVMAQGAALIAESLQAESRLDGVLGLGGSAGTTIATAAMRALPVGVPKLMVSTMGSGDTRPYVDIKDICMLYSVVDVAGINRISRRILSNAAAAMAGMVMQEPAAASIDRPLIGTTMFGVTTPCVTRARAILEAAGYEVLVFHATGSGGRAMEDLIHGGFLSGVLDITTTELADELVGGVLSAGPERLEAAGRAGIPQVVCPGAIDMVNFGPRETVPMHWKDRLFYQHNPTVTLMRTTPQENRELGRMTGTKLSRACGPVTILIPTLGVSALDSEGAAFYDPAALSAYREGLRETLDPHITVKDLPLHINDPAFAEAAAEALLARLRSQKAAP